MRIMPTFNYQRAPELFESIRYIICLVYSVDCVAKLNSVIHTPSSILQSISRHPRLFERYLMLQTIHWWGTAVPCCNYRYLCKSTHPCLGGLRVPGMTDISLRRHDIEKFSPYNWTPVKWIHRSPMDSPHKVQVMWMISNSLMLVRTGCWMNSRVAGDLRSPHV